MHESNRAMIWLIPILAVLGFVLLAVGLFLLAWVGIHASISFGP
jgi:hypothetical protein